MSRKKKGSGRSGQGGKQRIGGGAEGVSPSQRSDADLEWLLNTSKGRRQIWRRAKLIDKEGPHLLRTHRSKMSTETLWELADAARALRRHLKAPRKETNSRLLLEQSDHLDSLLSQHLGRYRKSASRQSTEAIVFALIIALFIRTFVFEPYRIPSGSMIPTLRVGDFIFVSKFVYGVKVPFTEVEFFDWREPKRGEIVIFDHPLPGPSYGETLIKRVMAVPGDRVHMRDNLWHVNGEPVATRVAVRGLDGQGRLQNACLPSPGEVCEWYPAEVSFDESGGTVHAEGAPQAGCPCSVLEESANGYTWNSQHIEPGVVCACSPPGKTFFGDCSVPALFQDGPTGEKSQVHMNWPAWPERRDMMQYSPWRGWTWESPSTAEAFARAAEAGEPLEVPEDHVMVMGDNRDHSSDGRIWGLVPMSRVRGKAGFTWIVTEELPSRIFRFVH